MTRILQVVDEALAASAAARNRAVAETTAIKEASALPRTELARELHSLASSLRNDSDNVSYSDIGGES